MVTKKSKTFTVEFHCPAEIDTPTHARVKINLAFARKIRRQARIVKEQDAYSLNTFDYSLEYLTEKDEGKFVPMGEDFRVQVEELVVTQDSINWTGVIKHTDITWTTDSILIKDLP